MKVNIGPYPKTSKTKRRINIKIDDYDVWGLDSTLAMIILPGLKLLKKKKHGAPYVDFEDVPENLKPPVGFDFATGQTDKNFFKRWDWIMNEMIWSFEQVNKDWVKKYQSGKMDMISIPCDKEGNELSEEDSRDYTKAEFYRMKAGPKHTFKTDDVGVKEHQKRINNGLRLFAKYYFNLWD